MGCSDSALRSQGALPLSWSAAIQQGNNISSGVQVPLDDGRQFPLEADCSQLCIWRTVHKRLGTAFDRALLFPFLVSWIFQLNVQAVGSLILVDLKREFTFSGWMLKANKPSQFPENQRESLYFLHQILQSEMRWCATGKQQCGVNDIMHMVETCLSWVSRLESDI